MFVRAGSFVPFLRDAFDDADLDGSGSLDTEELTVGIYCYLVSHSQKLVNWTASHTIMRCQILLEKIGEDVGKPLFDDPEDFRRKVILMTP